MSEFYRSRDATAFASYVDSSHFASRTQLKGRLRDYVNATAKRDTANSKAVASELAWLIPKYDTLAGVHDMRHLYDLYCRFDPAMASSKLALDSALKATWPASQAAWQSPEAIQELLIDLHRLGSGYERIGDTARLAEVMSCLGATLEASGQIDSALHYFEAGRRLSEFLDLRQQLAYCDLRLARIHSTSKADYSAAEVLLMEASESFVAIADSSRLGWVDMQRAYICTQLFQPGRAVELAKRAMLVARQAGRKTHERYCANLIAESYLESGECDSAAKYGELDEQVCRTMYVDNPTRESLSNLAHAESTIGRIYRHQGKIRHAEEQYERAHEHFQQSGVTSGICLNMLRLGELLEESGRYKEAEQIFGEVKSLSDLFEVQMYAAAGLAACEYRQGDSEGAQRRLTKNLARLERARASLDSTEMRAGLLADKIDPYDLLITIFLERYQATSNQSRLDSALLCLRRRNARTLTESLESDSASDASADQDCSFLESFGVQEPLSWRNQLLNERDALLIYQVSRFGCYVVVITLDTLALVEIGASQDSLQALSTTVLDEITRHPSSSRLSDGAVTAASTLHRLIVPESLLMKCPTPHIIVVPSGVLAYLPLEVLIDRRGQYLIEEFDVSYVPSTEAFALMGHRNAQGVRDQVVVFADPEYPSGSGFAPLEHSREEAEAIATTFGSNRVHTFVGECASVTALEETDYSSVMYLHIAAHGRCDCSDAEQSAIIMSPSAVDGRLGYLTSSDIRQIHLPVDLVFLSACRTASGRVLPGEGVISLARPFIEAGCNSVIASCWNVDDAASAELVGQFYRSIEDGNTAGHALSIAKRRLLQSNRLLRPHPYFWAPYILIGLNDCQN